MVLLASLVFTLTGCGEADAPLDSYWPVPEFSLTNQAGETVTRDGLIGKVWIADFFFTRCPGICPIMSGNLAALQASVADEPWADRVRLVSFSVDPERDTAEHLAGYAQDHGVKPGFWHLLTGEEVMIWNLATEGFKLPVWANPADPANPVGHSNKFVLVDATGTVRGLYDGTDPDALPAIERDLERLATDPASPAPASAR